MDRIILDSNIVLGFPEIFTKNAYFIIPDIVYAEIVKAATIRKEYSEVVEMINNNNYIKIYSTKSINEDINKSSLSNFIDFVDAMLIKFTQWYINEHSDEKVFLASLDNDIIKICRTVGIDILNINEFLKVKNEKNISKIQEKKLKRISLRVNVTLIKEIIIALIITFAGYLFFSNMKHIFKIVPISIIAIFLIIIGIALFWLRGRFRIIYGFVEIFIGVLAVSKGLNFITIGTNEIISIMAGLYIIVRGLDNIEKGIENYPRIYYYWKKIFYNKK